MLGYFNGYVLHPILERLAKRDISSKLQALHQFERLDRAGQKVAQQDAAYRLLAFCKAEIPYYSELFRERNFDIERVRTDLSAIQDLPILTKEIVREQADHLKAKSRGTLHVRKTGGSTGQSVFFYYDNEGLDWTAAINLRSYEMAGKYPQHSDFHISADLDFGVPSLKARALDYIRLLSQNRQRLLVSSFTDDFLGRVYEQMKSRNAYLVQGHPSSMYAIASYVERNHLEPVQICKVFEPSGEMLTQKMVDTIERNLLCKVFNRYGNAEFGVVAHARGGDPFTKLKVFESAFYVEPCRASNMIITAFTNFGFPLIRYDTGDVATVTEEQDGTFVSDIQGRVHDLVYIAGQTYPTHFIMDFLDHYVRGVREFQIVLTRESPVPVLNIVLENPADEARVRAAVLNRWPEGLAVQFIQFDDLVRSGWRQKFRHVTDLRNA